MKQLKDIQKHILSVIGGGDILLIVPPFGSLHDVALGIHILQALAEEKGFKTDILYLNMLLASVIGVKRYEEIYNAPLFWMAGERLFARSAYGLPPLGNHPEWCADEAMAISGSKTHVKMFYDAHQAFDPAVYLETERMCKFFMDHVTPVISTLSYKIVGCSTNIIGQVNCSIALLAGVKHYSPETMTILGGGNCEGEMAEGIASLSPAIDYIFSGESETTFLNFLKDYSFRQFPSQRIISGEPFSDLDSLPLTDYDIFLKQNVSFLRENALKNSKIWYESSRGCWWGEKGKCNFCGEYNIVFRQKTIDKRVQELRQIKNTYPDKMVFTTDNILPYKDLLPIITNKKEFPSLSCQLKSNICLQDLINLKNAKINAILPGIETFSTNLLKLMNKGITGKQNLLFLRNAFSMGIYVDWFLLWDFPGDHISDYEDMLCILPLIRHLQPPRKFESMQLIRFSPYINNHQKYKMSNLRPWAAYNMVYPVWAEIEKLAYYFIADYPCEAREHPRVIRKIADEVALWRTLWKNSSLAMLPFAGSYMIYDSRNIKEKPQKHILNVSQVQEIMAYGVYNESEYQHWAVEQKLGVIVDSWYVPLVTASPELLLKFEAEI